MGYQSDTKVEGLVPYGRGYANPLYGRGWWDGYGSITEDNHQHIFMETSKGINVNAVSLSIESYSDALLAYNRCSPLQGIVNRIAEALMNGFWRVVNEEGDDVSKDNETNSKIVNLLRYPNPLQTYSDFLKTIAIYRAIYGGAFIMASMPTGFNDISDAISLWVFSPAETEVVFSKNVYTATSIGDAIEKYVFTPSGYGATPLDNVKPEYVLPIYDTAENVGITSNKTTDAKRIKSLLYEIRNIMQAQEAIYSLNSDRGAQGIISNVAKDSLGYVPMDAEEKQRVQNRFRGKYGMMRGQDKVIVTDAALTYTPIGFNVKDLMIFEGVRENIMHICDAYNFPFDLLASEKGKTAADKRLSMAGLYQDNIIPLANDISEKLTLWFGLRNTDDKIHIDYSHLNIFQAGLVEKNNSQRLMAQAMHILFNGEVITREEYRRLMGLHPEIDENGTMRSELNADYARDDVRITTS